MYNRLTQAGAIVADHMRKGFVVGALAAYSAPIVGTSILLNNQTAVYPVVFPFISIPNALYKVAHGDSTWAWSDLYVPIGAGIGAGIGALYGLTKAIRSNHAFFRNTDRTEIAARAFNCSVRQTLEMAASENSQGPTSLSSIPPSI